MIKKRGDNFVLGLLIGIAGLILGFLGFAMIFGWINGTTIRYFIDVVFIEFPHYKIHIVTVAILFDVLPFYLAIRKNYIQIARGIMGIILLGVIAIAVFLI